MESLEKSHPIEQDNESQIVLPKVLPPASTLKEIYSKPEQIIKTAEFKDKGDFKHAIIKATNGKVIQGGSDKKLYILSSDLKPQQSISISGSLISGMAIGKRIFCGQWDKKVTVFDEDTLELINTINTQEIVNKMLLIDDDYLLFGQSKGYITIIQLSTLSSIFQDQLSQKPFIYDMIKTSNPNEYAIAADGIQIVNIERDGDNKFSLIQDIEEEPYLQGETVVQIAEVHSNKLIACVSGTQELQVFSTRSKQFIGIIKNGLGNGGYNTMQKVIGYNDETFPYLLLQDTSKVSLINTKKFKAKEMIQSYYEAVGFQYSMAQFQENNDLKLLKLYHNSNTDERSIKEFVIGSL